MSGSPTIAIAFALFGAAAPTAIVRYRERRRTTELRELWPEVVDNIASAVRAGLALPEAVAAGLVKIAGNGTKVAELFALLDDFTIAFEVVEPLRTR